MVHDYTVDLGDDPGLAKDGVEAELQELLAKRVAALREDLRLVRREYPTDIGPVDLLCRDGEDRAVVDRGETGRWRSKRWSSSCATRSDSTSTPASLPPLGMFVATRIKRPARVFASSRGISCVEIDLDELRAGAPLDLRLFLDSASLEHATDGLNAPPRPSSAVIGDLARDVRGTPGPGDQRDFGLVPDVNDLCARP